MIERREIIEAARALSLLPRVIEKDYVLGWVLAAIYAHPKLAPSWVFKGGTCLKKCFFETYRFSEDLDFTINNPRMVDESLLKDVFADICDWVYEHSGIETFSDRLRFDVYENPRGHASCQGRFYYRGPVSPRGDPPMIKLDLTADEILVREPVTREVHHPYSDCPREGIQALCYTFEEIFGEKVRALGERCRPRDLYDAVHLYRRSESGVMGAAVNQVLNRKCEFKSIDRPSPELLASHRNELNAAWSQMLDHQLQILPPVDDFWDALPDLFAWLEMPAAPAQPKLSPISTSGSRVDRLGPLPGGVAYSRASSAMESVFFAAANRLCVDLAYKNRVRRIEPYALRRTNDGNLLLYAVKAGSGEIRAYRVDRIEGATVTNQSFKPQHALELTSVGPISIPRVRPRRTSARESVRSRRQLTKASGGVRFVHECPMCGRRFIRKTASNTLRPHKDKNGFPCAGRRAILVETKG